MRRQSLIPPLGSVWRARATMPSRRLRDDEPGALVSGGATVTVVGSRGYWVVILVEGRTLELPHWTFGHQLERVA